MSDPMRSGLPLLILCLCSPCLPWCASPQRCPESLSPSPGLICMQPAWLVTQARSCMRTGVEKKGSIVKEGYAQLQHHPAATLAPLGFCTSVVDLQNASWSWQPSIVWCSFCIPAACKVKYGWCPSMQNIVAVYSAGSMYSNLRPTLIDAQGSFRSRHQDNASPDLHNVIQDSVYGQRFQAHTDFDANHARMESLQDERYA